MTVTWEPLQYFTILFVLFFMTTFFFFGLLKKYIEDSYHKLETILFGVTKYKGFLLQYFKSIADTNNFLKFS